MPRPKPAPDLQPVRTTISIPAYLYRTAEIISAASNPPENLSVLFAKALFEYAEKHGHLDVVADARRKLSSSVSTGFSTAPKARPESAVAKVKKVGESKSA